MTTPDTEWSETELYIDLAPEVSHRITAREGVLTNRLQMKAGEIVGMKELLTSRDTYWKERVRKKVWGGIICGFAGVGKSTLAKNMNGVVDLESTPFEKDWKRYVKVAKHVADSGYLVLLSCHKELREELHAQGITYKLAIPNSTSRQEYISRYRERGNDETFVKHLDENWEKSRERLPWESEYILVRNNLTEALDTLLDNLK